MYALTGLFLSLALFFASICGPGTYWEMTVIDPIFEVTAPGGEKAGLDLTGLGLTLGLGGDEAGENGILRVSGHFGSETQSAAAVLRDGLATVILDGFDALLTASLVEEEDLALLLASLYGGDPDAIAALTGWMLAMLSGEEDAPAPEGMRVESPGPGETVVWLESIRVSVRQWEKIWHVVFTRTPESGPEDTILEISAHRAGDGGKLKVSAAWGGQTIFLAGRLEANDPAGWTLALTLTVPGGGSARLDCKVALRAAPLEGYVDVALPGDMDRIDVSTLSEADVDRLEALLTTRLAVNLLRVPGLFALLRGE